MSNTPDSTELERVEAPDPGASIVDGILNSLRAAIVEGILPPGFRLREIPLSHHFGCSTTPVREALRRLEYDGLVVTYPRRGAEVIAIGGDKLEDLYEIRLLLECHAAHRAASIATPDAVDDLREILRRSERLADSDDLVLLNAADMEFHGAISGLSGNPVLAELVERVTRQILVMRVRTKARVPGGPARAHDYHQSILEAIAEHDPDKAESLMRDHIEWSAAAVMAALSRRERADV